MRFALSEISTVNASFAEDVAAYAAAGFDGIGIWEMKLPDDNVTNIALLRDAALGVASCVPTIPSILPLRLPGMEGPPDPSERIDALCASVRRLAAFEPECVLCLTGPAGDLEPARARDVVVRRAPRGGRSSPGGRRALRSRAGAPGTARDRLVREHHRRHARAPRRCGPRRRGDHGRHIQPLARAARGVRRRGRARNGAARRRRAAGSRPYGSRPPGRRRDRSADIVGALVAAGWDGYLDVEIFSTPDLFWGLPVDEAARRAHAAISRL